MSTVFSDIMEGRKVSYKDIPHIEEKNITDKDCMFSLFLFWQSYSVCSS